VKTGMMEEMKGRLEMEWSGVEEKGVFENVKGWISSGDLYC
jgi:hypothetical protein